jgi:hypothetical protein
VTHISHLHLVIKLRTRSYTSTSPTRLHGLQWKILPLVLTLIIIIIYDIQLFVVTYSLQILTQIRTNLIHI